MDIIEYIRPKYCICCERFSKEYICDTCLSTLQRVMPICPICNRLSNGFLKHGRCTNKYSPSFIVSLYRYSKIAHKIISTIKYRYSYKVLNALLNNLNIKAEFTKDSILVPIPMYWRKQLDRGFNQTEIIAKHISQIYKVDTCNALYKTKDTKPQSEHKIKERLRNVEDVFRLSKEDLSKVKRIVLVDDIVTSKATIISATRTIKEKYPDIDIGALTLFHSRPYRYATN